MAINYKRSPGAGEEQKRADYRGSLVSSQFTPHCWEHTSGLRGTRVRDSLHVTHVQLVKKWAVNRNGRSAKPLHRIGNQFYRLPVLNCLEL